MNWEFLLLLACPLMMLFCMKGMFTGNKDKKSVNNSVNQQANQGVPNELEAMQIKMAELMEQNHELMKEVKEMKKSQGNTNPFMEAPKLKTIEESKKDVI